MLCKDKKNNNNKKKWFEYVVCFVFVKTAAFGPVFESIVKKLNSEYNGNCINFNIREPMDISSNIGFDLIDAKYISFRDFIVNEVVCWMNNPAIKGDRDAINLLSGVAGSGKSKEFTEIAKILRQTYGKAAILISFNNFSGLTDDAFDDKSGKLTNPKFELIIRILYGIFIDKIGGFTDFNAFRGRSEFDQLLQLNEMDIKWEVIIDCLFKHCDSIRNSNGIVLLIDELLKTGSSSKDTKNIDEIDNNLYQFLKEIVINNNIKRSHLAVVFSLLDAKKFMEIETKPPSNRKVTNFIVPLLDSNNYGKLQKQLILQTNQTKFEDWPQLFPSKLEHKQRLQDIDKCKKKFGGLTLEIVRAFELLLRLSQGRPRVVINILQKYEEFLVASDRISINWNGMISESSNGEITDDFIDFSVDIENVSNIER